MKINANDEHLLLGLDMMSPNYNTHIHIHTHYHIGRLSAYAHTTLTPMIALSSVMVTCLARSTAAATCC